MGPNEAIAITDLEPQGEVKGGGDVNGDGFDDIIVGAGGPSGHVKSSGVGSNTGVGALRNVSGGNTWTT